MATSSTSVRSRTSGMILSSAFHMHSARSFFNACTKRKTYQVYDYEAPGTSYFEVLYTNGSHVTFVSESFGKSRPCKGLVGSAGCLVQRPGKKFSAFSYACMYVSQMFAPIASPPHLVLGRAALHALPQLVRLVAGRVDVHQVFSFGGEGRVQHRRDGHDEHVLRGVDRHRP